ncbi:HBR504Cp [Eremothecium sinecaudum]|uniref:Deoxycytidylate deaminase n=1 Tax=Eremothecium sinecaudum TaxID=45286 RepID=A0A109UVN4_9SACH|nr:HBR504Cp [Eremothecium sinecaudum]AMD19405.1 HBR504Cp [Eremothecium sinecaudum]
MLVGVSGTYGSGYEEVGKCLARNHGFETVKLASFEDNWTLLKDFATANYAQRYVLIGMSDVEMVRGLEQMPGFVHLAVDAPLDRKVKLCDGDHVTYIKGALAHDSAEQLEVCRRADVQVYVASSPEEFLGRLEAVLEEIVLCQLGGGNVMSPKRPSWDTYFMKLAKLAASRSNCMKRRVGCVIVRDCRVIATGYNGTPRNLTNCNAGGCPRCNGGESSLQSCLCLHAEENALLEAGRDRVGQNAILYCDTCPCLTCSVKIVQTGVSEVVYSQSYRMDKDSFDVLERGGVKVRQFSSIEEHKYVI